MRGGAGPREQGFGADGPARRKHFHTRDRKGVTPAATTTRSLDSIFPRRQGKLTKTVICFLFCTLEATTTKDGRSRAKMLMGWSEVELRPPADLVTRFARTQRKDARRKDWATC